MAKKYKAKYVSADEYNTKKNYVSPEEYAQLKRQRQSERERQRQLRKQAEEKRAREESFNRTKEWQKAYKDAQYGPDGDQRWQVYAAKQISDTPGALEKEQERQRKQEQEQQARANQYWRDLSRSATEAGVPEVAYATKMIHDTPVSMEDISKYGTSAKAKQAKLNDFLNGIKKTYNQKQTGSKTENGSSVYADESAIQRRYINQVKEKNGYTELSPMEQYESLPEDEKSSWLKTSSKNVQQILSMDNVQNWYNSHPFSRDLGDLQDEQTALSRQIEEINKEIETENAAFANRPKLSEDERRSLQEEAYNLKGQYNKNYLYSLDEYGLQIPANFATGIQNVTVHNKPEDYLNDAGDYHDKTIYYDSVLYDAIHGEGAYSNVMNNGTDEEQTAADNEVEDLWTRLENGTLHELADQHPEVREKEAEIMEQLEGYNSKLQELESNRRYIQKNLEDTKKQIAEQERYYDYMGQYNVPAGSGYIPELDRGGQAYSSMAEIERGVQTTDVHRIWSFINKGKEYQAWSKGMDLPPVTNEYNYAGLMNDREKDVFNDFYKNGQYDEALSFLEGLKQIALIQRYSSDVENIRIQETARTLPAMTSIASLMMKQANTYLDIPRHIAGWLGDENVKNANSAWYAPARQSEIIENAIANKIGGTGGKIYSNVMNSLSNLVRGLTTPGGGTSKLAQEILGLGGFFLQVDQEATYRHLKDNDYDTARKLGAMDAIFEVAEEFLPYETMLGSVGKNVGLAILQSSLSEFGQEFTGALVFDRIKDMIQGKDGTQERADEIFNQGYYIDSNGNKVELDKNKDIALKQARVRAAKEYWDTAVENGLAGFMGGGLGGLYGTMAQAIGTETTGRTINKNKGQDGTTGIDMLLGIGKKMKNSSALAEKLQGKIDKGEKAGNYQTGKLAQAIQEEALQTLNNAQSSYGDKLDAIDTLNSMAEIVGNVQRTEAPENKNLWAKPEEVQQLEQEGKARIKGNREAVYYDRETGNGTFVQISNITTEKNKDGRWELKLTISENGKTRSVNATDLKMTDTVAATVLREADLNPEYYSGKYVSTLLDAAEKGQLAKDGKTLGKQLHEAELIRMYAYAGKNADEMGLNNLLQEVQHDIWMQSAEEHRENRQEQVKQAGRLKEARIQYKGTEYGTEAWNNLKLDKNIKAQMDVIAGIAQRAGVSVDFEELAEDTIYGSQSGKKIAINVNGVNYDTITKEATGRHHMLATFGHEFTHWLMNNSTTGYNHLEHYVLDKLINTRGVSAVMGVIDGYRNGVDHLNMEDAIAEIVAEASDAVLMDENVIRHIQETDGKLYTAIKGFVKDLVGRLKDAIGLMKDSQSSISRAMANYANELNRLWMGAYDEALSGTVEDANIDKIIEEAADNTRWSIARLPNGNQYVELDIDQEQFNKLKPSQMMKVAKGIIRDRFAKENNNKYALPDKSGYVIVNSETYNEYAYPSKRQLTTVEKKAKGRASTELDNLIKVSWRLKPGDALYPNPSTGHTPKNVKYYATRFRINGKKFYTGILNVEVRSTGQYLIDLTQIKEDTSLNGANIQAPGQKAVSPASVKQTIPQNNQNNNTRKSRAQLDNDYMAAVESGDMVTAQRMVNEEALRSGVYTNVRGRPLKLFHGTQYFGFTIFDTTRAKFKTGALFTTTNNSVANGYSEFGRDRESNSKYIEDDGTDKTLIKNAKNVLGQNWRRLNNDDVKAQRERLIEEFKKQAEIENEALNDNSEYYPPDEISNQFWNVVAALDSIVGEDEYYFDEDTEYAEHYRENNKIRNYYEQWKQLREYYNDNDEEYQKLKEEGNKYYQIILNSYEHSDALIDLEYVYKKLLNQSEMFIKENTNDIASRDELQKEIELWKDKGNYTLYGIPGNKPLIIDANKDHWTAITVPEIGTGTYMTDEIVKWAKAHNYTSVVIKNVMDPGIVNEYGDDYIFFNSNQLKSADPVTYDDNGKVIPLSKRFNEQKADIRWSRAQLDDDYMATVNIGRYDLAEKLVDEAAKKAGYTIKAYHGTPNGKFTVFDRSKVGTSTDFGKLGRGFYFSSKKQVADYYAGYLNSSTVMPVYLKLNNPFVLDRNYDNMTVREMYDSILGKGGIVDEQRSEELTRWLIDNGYDGIIADGEYMVLDPKNIKSAETVTYDKYGDVIPLSERFNDEKTDIRWSRALSAEEQATVDEAEANGIDLNIADHTASRFSRASFMRSEYYKDPDKMARMLAQNVLGSTSRANIAKAKKWIQDVTSISAMIGEKPILDYVASKGRSSFKSNPEYGGSIDSSTICAKRRLQTGTIDAIQRAMPNYVMTAEDFLRVRRMMKERGYEVSCGLCFVESSRKNIAKYASQFMNEWNSQHPDNQVNMTQINTVLGLEETRTNRKEVYDAYEKFMNKLAQRKPKLFEMRSEYDNDILKHFRNDDSVEAKNRNGGMRINSFSDFEIVHLIDMMQVIMDMSNVGLAGQAYTKVREFAEALGPTGLKINMSMIAAGVDENGKIIFDEVEGMKWNDVKDLRDKYADNVGTVCVVFTEDQLMAAMADDRIDFIIPFHRSQWNKSNYKDIGLPENVKDFTYWQNERYAKPVYGKKKDGTPKKLRATNYMPNEYWNPNLSGKENAEAYLKMCAENNKIPKFWKWLQSNGDGSFSLKDDGSTDGYWKLLGDFKMYNHLTGDYAAQQAVKPEFDMDASRQMLENYKGGHETFPEATDVVQDFVKEKMQGRKGLSAGKNGKIQLAGNEIENVRMSRWTESGMDVNYWMEHVTPSALQTEDEWKMVQAYRGKRTSMALSLKKQLDMKAQIRQLEGKADLTTDDRNALIKLRNNLKTEQDKYARLEDEIAEITSDSGWAGIMRQHNVVFRDYMEGKTQEQVQAAIDSLTEEVKRSDKRITDLEKDLAKLEEQNPVKTVKKLLARKGLSRTVNALRSEYSTAMSEEELKNRMAEIVIKNASGEDITTDVEALARDMLQRVRGEQNENLTYLRGTTLNIGESVLDEYIAERSLLNEVRKNDRESDETVLKRARKAALQEIRNDIKGSGIKIIAEGKKSRFREQWNDLREGNGGLKDISDYTNENDALNDILKDIKDWLNSSAGNQQYNVGPEQEAELEAFITASANIMLNEETGGMNKTQLIEAIRKGAGPISQALAAVREVKGSMEGLKAAGQKAQTWAGVLNEDTQQALKYYNKMARLAAETERRRVKESVIESLKSDHAKAMLQQAEKFREQIANDKKARELAEDNAALRSKISTVTTRMANRIFAETDQKNVPEETKGLVRQVLDMISQHDGFFRKVTYWDKQQVENVRGRLQRMIAHYGKFDADNDLDWLVVKAADPADNDYTAQDKVMQDLVDIETGLLEYRNAEGQGRISLADRKAALAKVQEALSEIWDVVQARSEMEIAGRKWQVIEMAEMMRNDMNRSRFKGERTGFGSKARDTISGGITWGNLTPEYFFKNLKNRAMDLLHRGLKIAENRSGLEAAQAKARLAQIAEENGFRSWDGQEEHKVRVSGGKTITMTTEQIMALYATWLREGNQLRPADTSHLLNGGFVLAEKENNKGKPGRQKADTRPLRMNEDMLAGLAGYLTDAQKKYVDDMVAYMSSELAELGNEASMKMYGIKKFTEEYYFPIKSWGGVLNRRSDAGVNASNENRAAQQGFSKRVKNNANNAIEIGDFTPTAIKHVAGMITYNTVGPAIENMNKVLNQRLVYGEIVYTPDGQIAEDDTYKQNMRAAFTNAYGKQAGDYLAKFMKDMNGGVTTERTAFDKLLSLFKKNAVAGSLSVAAQQPLSYIRAAMMINPKYLAAAINPIYWKGSYAEMMKHSGIAVIKEMGKFDMNFGQTMQEWIAPEGMESKAKKAWNKTSELVTGLPGAMDMMTWTRMWTAVKLEQMAENKGADFTSDEFMAKVADRFNDLMRRTQVYDSVMTKSQNMRSTHFYAKTLTSFMAEPTLSLNVLADAFQNMKEKGGKAKVAKALATFLLSAAAQAGAKAFFGAGRTPDKKKNKEENFLNKFWYNLLSEANPFGLIPGYRQIVETLTDGEFKDDTMGMIAKAGDVVDRIWKLATGEIGQKGLYRDLEDSIGQALQLMTDIPAKNIMRDFRAMVNWFSGGAAQGFTGDTYAQRETSGAVLKYQLIDNLMSNDLMGLVNKKLEDAGYKTTNAAYYDRLYAATASGNKQAAEEIRDYLINGKGVSEKTIQTNMSSRINKDDDLSGPEKVQQKLDNGASVSSIKTWITQNYKQAYIDADTNGRRQLMNELTKMYKLLGISGDDAMKTVTKWVKDEKKK